MILAIFPVKIGLIGGEGGVPEFLVLIGIFQFLLLGSPCKNLYSYDKSFWDIFEIIPFSGQNRVNWGARGVLEIFFSLESSYLCYLGAHAKICTPMISLSGIYLKLAHFPVKIGLIGGLGGSPKFDFHWNPPIFVT